MTSNIKLLLLLFITPHLFSADLFSREAPTTMHPLEMHTPEFSRQLASSPPASSLYESLNSSALHYALSPNPYSSSSYISADSCDEESPDDQRPAPARSAKRSTRESISEEPIQRLLSEFNTIRTATITVSAHLHNIHNMLAQLTKYHSQLVQQQAACTTHIQALLQNQHMEDAILTFYNEQNKLVEQFKQQISPIISTSTSSSSSAYTLHDNVDTTAPSSDTDPEGSRSSSSTSHSIVGQKQPSQPLPAWDRVNRRFKNHPPKEAIKIITALIEKTKKYTQSDAQQHRLNLLYLARVRKYISLHKQGLCQSETVRIHLSEIDPKSFKGRTRGDYKALTDEFNVQNSAKRQRR